MKLEKNHYRDNMHDLQLRVSRGDQEAFELLYDLYNRKLLSFAKNFLKSREMAEEICEDVFVKLWCNRDSLVHIQNLNVYLYTAIKNHALNALSKEARRVVTCSLEEVDNGSFSTSDSPHELLVTSEVMQSVKNAIDVLPPRCKIIFQLVREDGLRYKEVSDILNISVNTIDAQMAIAVKRLCSSLGVDKRLKCSIQKK
ncbi:RNA polymerase sigma-70 factor [Arcticibacter sp.]|jgi:RNA polymerase sigma-70 factor (ECF subfamily)|uniref:RNA polymerase sigma-70 factor n=1 Tax=Arcticibacter sp. TaxID=1872630 RepID=UPI0038905295